MGSMFLVMVDSHSKWMDVHRVNSSNARMTAEKLSASFATHGIPNVLVSNSELSFTSQEFAYFMKPNGIRYIRTAQYHPSPNSLEERAVQKLKAVLKKQPTASLDTTVQIPF